MKRRLSRKSANLPPILARAKRAGIEIPTRFDDFVKRTNGNVDGGLFSVTADKASTFGLTADGARAIVPFLRLGDGSVVAFWATAGKLPIVHYDSERGAQVVGVDFDDFLARVALRKSRVPDIDEWDDPLVIVTVKPRPFGALAKAFTVFNQTHREIVLAP